MGKEVMLPRLVSSPFHCTVPPAQAREQFSCAEPPNRTTGCCGVTASLSAGRPGWRKEETAGFREGDNHQNPVVYKANGTLVPPFAEKWTVTLRRCISSIPITMGGALLISNSSLGAAKASPRSAAVPGQLLGATRHRECRRADMPVAIASPGLPHRRHCHLIRLGSPLRFSSHFVGK